MEVTEKPAKNGRGFRLIPRTWRGKAGLVLVLFFLVIGGAWGLSRAVPPWYEPLDPDKLEVIDESDIPLKRASYLATAVEHIPLGEQSWFIRQSEINSYLAVSFAPPLDVNGKRMAVSPRVFSDPVVTFTPGKVTVSARIARIPSSNPKGGVGSVVFSVDIVTGADGKRMGLVKISSVWVGLLPVPRSLLYGRLQPLMPAMVDAIMRPVQVDKGPQWADKNLPYVQEIVEAVLNDRPFPLAYTIDRKSFAIKNLRPDQDAEGGVFTVVLVPTIPQAVAVPGGR